MNTKIIIGIVGVFAVGFIGFQVLKVQSPNATEPQRVIKSVDRRITMSPFIARTPETLINETVTNTPQEDTNIEPPDIETIPVPEHVPTAESSDDEIREFHAWLSTILEAEDTTEEIEQEDFTAEEDTIDDDLEKSVINSVIEEQWGNSLETSACVRSGVRSIWNKRSLADFPFS